jgi:hypothetical protein
VSCSSAAAASRAIGATSGAANGACAATMTWRARTVWASPPCQAVDEQLVPVGAQLAHAAAGAGAVAELAAQRCGQPARPPSQVASGERALASPHEREQADAAARRQLGRLRGGATRRAGEDGVDGRRQRTEEVGEGPVALECEHARPHVTRRLARGGLGEPLVGGHRALDLQPGLRERDPLAQRQREPEGIGLDPSAVEQPGPDGQAHHAAGDRDGLEAAVAGHRVHERPGGGEQVRAVVHPVVAAWVRAQPAAEPLLGLQKQQVTVAQPPCR